MEVVDKNSAFAYLCYMNPFAPENYFNLNECCFREIFDPSLPVWEALKQISIWIRGQKLGKIEGAVSPQAFVIDPENMVIGKGSVIEAGAYLKGPLWIGENVTIRHGAYLRGDVIVGARSVVGHDTEVKESIFMNGAHAAHFAYVGNSILGNQVNLGAGTKLANLRLDGAEISIEEHKTGMRKLGAILGDFVQIGCNAVLNPGTVMGKGSTAYPLTNVSGVIPAQMTVAPEVSFVLRSKK